VISKRIGSVFYSLNNMLRLFPLLYSSMSEPSVAFLSFYLSSDYDGHD
jgi:hypothetical protein